MGAAYPCLNAAWWWWWAGQFFFHITGNMDGSRQGTGQGSATAPSYPSSLTNPWEGTGNEEFLWHTLLPAVRRAEVARCQHTTKTFGTHCDPSPAHFGFGPGLCECVAMPVWVYPSFWLTCCPRVVLSRGSCSECSSTLHPHPTLTVSSSFPCRRKLQLQHNRTVCSTCWMGTSWRQMIV